MSLLNTKYKYKIYYQLDNKVKIIYKDNLEVDNIIKYKKVSKEFTVSNSEIFLFLSDIKNLLKSNIKFYNLLSLIKNNQNKKIVDFLEKNYNQFLPNNNILFIFINFSKKNSDIKENLLLLHSFFIKKRDIIEKIFDSLKYPVFLFMMLIVLLLSASNILLPKMELFYKQNDIALPIYSQLLLKTNKFLLNNLDTIFIFLFILFGLGFVLFSYKKEFFWKKLFKIAVIRNFYLYKIFSLLSIMVKTNNSFYNSIKIVKDIEQNIYIKDILDNILNKIGNGVKFDKAIENKLFDEVSKKLLVSGYYSNDFQQSLDDISIFYKDKIEKNILFFKSYLNPAMIFLVFLSILFLIMAIFLPMWNIGELIK